MKVALKKPAAATAIIKHKINLPFPGKPVKGADAILWGKYRIYTDFGGQKYRVLEKGVKVDKGVSFKVAKPIDAWKQVLEVLHTGY